MKQEFVIGEVHVINDQLPLTNDQLFVKIRNTGKMKKAEIMIKGQPQGIARTYNVVLDEPEFGVSPGQHCVIYRKLSGDNYVVLGGGVIVN